jgi:DNA-binding transcriptional MerR regulator
MKTYSISTLARGFGLSRSTLLYYDRIGLLAPSGRTFSGYRCYTEKERRRLERVCYFRQAGLSLEEIKAVFAGGGKPGVKLLESRMRKTAEELLKLRNKQRLLAGMLNSIVSASAASLVDKKMWVEMLRAAGMNDDAMLRWHAEFERRSPQGHQEFLVSLGIPEYDVQRIRNLSETARVRHV